MTVPALGESEGHKTFSVLRQVRMHILSSTFSEGRASESIQAPFASMQIKTYCGLYMHMTCPQAGLDIVR